MKTLIVIVNWRTPDLTIDALRSIAPQVGEDGVDARVIVTDNNSGDDSVSRIGEAIKTNGWADWATLMPLPKNGGFAYGNNAAIRSVLLPPYVLLLNPDTVAYPGALKNLIQFMDARRKIGIAGSRLEDPDGTVQRSAYRFHGVASEFEKGMKLGIVSKLMSSQIVAPPAPTHACRCDWVGGASMIVRREVFEKIGLLDEKFFMYFEEVDFCRRARAAGFETWYVPASRVMHIMGAASEVSDQRRHRKRRPAYWFESRRRYFLKSIGLLGAAAADLAFIIGFAIWRVRRIVQRKPDPDPPMFLWDFLRHSVLVRGSRL